MCLLDLVTSKRFWCGNKEELWLPWGMEYVAEERKKEIFTENISKALTGRDDKATTRLECRGGKNVFIIWKDGIFKMQK